MLDDNSLESYIKDGLSKGKNLSVIKKELSSSIFTAEEINKAIYDLESVQNNSEDRVNVENVVLSGIKKYKNKKIFIVSLVIFALLISVIGIVYAYFMQRPEVILSKALIKTAEVNTGIYSTDIYGTFTSISEDNLGFQNIPGLGISLQGSFDMSDNIDDLNLSKIKNKLNLSIYSKQNDNKNIFVNFDTRVAEEKLYFNLLEDNLSDNMYYQMLLSGFLEGFKNKWYFIDLKELSTNFSEINSQVDDNPEELDSQFFQNNRKEIIEISQKYKIYNNLKKIGEDNIDDIQLSKYQFDLDIKETARFMLEISQKYPELNLNSEDIQESIDSIQTEESIIQFIIWIGNNDGFIHKVDIVADKLSTTSSSLSGESAVSVSLEKMEISFQIKDHNQPIQVEVPENALDIVKIFSGEIDTDGEGLSDIEELLYKTDINNPDTDGDGYTDKQEIDAWYDPLGKGKLLVEF